ncbi:MAG: TIGR03936 family radical SAM-associated protein [Eubacteriales bacterium]|nr:TIGR03936 family radical SAM-associated protein [Eubacteriales bacterium]
MANFEICFSKEGDIKYISHLDVMRMFRRAFKRAGLDLVYSNGFNPHPKLSIAAPLPLGFTSTDEWMDVETKEDFRADNLKQALQQEMPVGITILEVRAKELQPNKANPMLAARVTAAKYMIAADLPEQTLAKIQQDTAEQFLAQEHIFVEKRQKKKKTMQKVDIRNKIRSLLLHRVDDKLFLSTLLSTGSASNLNPSLLLHAFLAWLDPGTEPLDVEIMRRKLYFDA